MADRLRPNESLSVGQSISAQNRAYRFIMQADGNLVLYMYGKPLWASNTSGPNRRVIMQDDGNLVIYDPNNNPVWASNTHGQPGAWVIAQDDGNVVIYGPGGNPLWATNTVTGRTLTDRLNPSESLMIDDWIKSQNSVYRLIMQADGNLVLYNNGGPLWASNTSGPNRRVIMQDDGNLVIYDPNNNPVWASNTHGQPGAWVIAQDDGNVVIYGPRGNSLWATNTVQSAPAPTPDAQGIENLLKPFGVILNSVANGQFSLWSLPLSSVGVPGSIPLGWRVCIDKSSSLAIKNSINKNTFSDLKSVLEKLVGGEASKLLEALQKSPSVKEALDKIAAAIVAAGIPIAGGSSGSALLTAAASLFLAIVVLIAYHYLAIIGQIALLELQGEIGNGVCLQHPLLVIAAGAAATASLIIPAIIILQVGLHLPVVVTSR